MEATGFVRRELSRGEVVRDCERKQVLRSAQNDSRKGDVADTTKGRTLTRIFAQSRVLCDSERTAGSSRLKPLGMTQVKGFSARPEVVP